MRGKIDFMPMLDILLILFFAAFILAQEAESAETVTLEQTLEATTERLREAEKRATSLAQEKGTLESKVATLEEQRGRVQSSEREVSEKTRRISTLEQDVQKAREETGRQSRQIEELTQEIARLQTLVPSQKDLRVQRERMVTLEQEVARSEEERGRLAEQVEAQRDLLARQSAQLREAQTSLAASSQKLTQKEAELEEAARRAQNLEEQSEKLYQKGQGLEAEIREHEETIARLRREREHQDVAYQQLKTLYAINLRDTMSRLIVKYAPKYLNFAMLDATGNDPVILRYEEKEKELYQALSQDNAIDLVRETFEELAGKKLDPTATIFFLIIGPNTLQKFELIGQSLTREGLNVEPFALYEMLQSESQ